jgi:hypothetical protein
VFCFVFGIVLLHDICTTILQYDEKNLKLTIGVVFLLFFCAFCVDNDLEYFIRDDLTEITYSPAVQDAANMVTWVYFDGRNFGSATADGTSHKVCVVAV